MIWLRLICLWQSKANDIRADRNSDELLAVYQVSHGGRLVFPAGGKVPKGLSVPFVKGYKIPVRVPIKQQPPSGRQHTRVSLTLGGSDLRHFPYNFPALNIECAQILLCWRLRRLLHIAAVGGDSPHTLLQGHNVIEPGGRAESGGIPIRCSLRATNVSLHQGLGTTVGPNPTGPRHLTDEWLTQQDLAVGPVEHVKESIAIRKQ